MIRKTIWGIMLLSLVTGTSFAQTPAPKPYGPVPNENQLRWQEMEYYSFLHFSLNTFTDQEWGNGDESPNLFNPKDLDCRQWARVCKEAGMKGIILTVKHHCGFCLWPSKYTEFSVKNSPWKDGKGDVVRELADACKEYGLKLGVYLSPWDRNSADYGKPEYITYFRNQLTELLTNYGPIFEVWFDGANGGSGYYGGARETRRIDRKTYYDWQNTYKLIRKLQPNIVIWNDGGDRGDLRWVGTEAGFVGETNWSLLNATGDVPEDMLRFGVEDGDSWVPGEVNTSIRPGWFYHTNEDSRVKTVPQLMNIYYSSIGRNATLLLNFPIDTRGLIHENDAKASKDFAAAVKETFAVNLAEKAKISASNVRGNSKEFGAEKTIDGNKDTYWATDDGVTKASLTLDFGKPTTFNRFLVQEYIRLGQRVKAFTVEAFVDSTWKEVAKATTIGYKRILLFPTVKATRLRFNITDSKSCPVISNIGIYNAPQILTASGEAQNTSQKVPAKRIRDCFDFDWMFHKGDIAIKYAVKAGRSGGLTDINVEVAKDEAKLIDYSDAKKPIAFKPADWQKVDLPHDWCVEGTFVNDNSLGSQPAATGFLPTGIGFYRKEFEITEEDKGKKISIEFDGIYRNSSVWVNGNFMGNHPDGYTPSYYDLTDVLRYGTEGKNIILVRVDGRESEGWWYEGCGIYRHVWLTKTDRLHVDRFGTFITTPSVTEAKAVVDIITTVKNEYKESKNISLVSKIADNKGVILDTKSTTLSIAPFSQSEISQKGSVQKPLLWSPETPSLYKVLTEVVENGNVVDTYETTFGIRTIEINTSGFYLNGKLYPVKGTANHQDFAGIGVALPDKINEYKIRLLKEMGCNGYRSAHNPPTPELLDICDRLGMLVLDENRLLSSSENGLNDLTTLLYRDRNHPSIFMWSMENEESIQGTTMGTRILETMVETTHRTDSTRPVTAAMNHGWNSGGYSDVLDVVGYNYGDKRSQYVKDHEKYQQRKMFATESTSFVSTRGEYEINREKGYVSNIGPYTPDWGPEPGKDWEQIVLYPYLGGTFVWTGFDYRGEPTPYLWPCVSSHFGIMDICGFPKDGYYAYQAAWTNTPIVHIFPHWNWQGKEGKPIKLYAYTNCEEVELFFNGKSIGKKKSIPFTKLEWELVYKPGKLEAQGYNKGRTVAKDIVETTTAPSQIALNSDINTLKSDGCDVAVIRVAIKDARGRVVPVADNLVKFSIEGPGKIIGTGNGDPSSHEPDKATQRRAFNGYCLVLVQTDKIAGEIRLKASSETLRSAEVLLKSE